MVVVVVGTASSVSFYLEKSFDCGRGAERRVAVARVSGEIEFRHHAAIRY